ncbi:hypothetical protein Hs30E_13980 [Lactococcus hodotermopsidis]|uniref:Uncharacterized protein n=1 Tax=Pseudolactococcus hodotermopsidis TaxID=2709157 RepID=A0A6A0BG70_9LACT|nr:DUF3270 family protein [Lactococcus hodotermopsidis]GFH42847.1 hypothetical protein Hs30E_13980 [Lactococcus hodotermopsidis]
MEAPKYDEDLTYWQAPTREFLAEEKAVDDKMIAERFTEIAFFSKIAVFSIFLVLACDVFASVMPDFLAVPFAIVFSYILLLVSHKTIKTFLSIIIEK